MRRLLISGALSAALVLVVATANTADARSSGKNPNDCTTPIVVIGE